MVRADGTYEYKTTEPSLGQKKSHGCHRANLVNFGIVPFTFADAADYDKLAAGDRLELKGIRAAVAGDGRLAVRTQAGTITLQTALSDREKAIILAGGLLCLK